MDQVMTLTKAVEKARFRSYLSQVLPGPLHPSSLPRPLQNDKKRPKDAPPIRVGGEVIGILPVELGRKTKKKEKRRKGSRCCSSCRKMMYGLRQFRDQAED
jgi:hypothetical protein